MRKQLLAIIGAVILAGAGHVCANPADLDTTFNTTGTHSGTATAVSKAIVTGQLMNAKAVVVQPDGKIVLVGSGTLTLSAKIIVTRLTSTGIIDTTFGNNGSVAIRVDQFEVFSVGTCVALQTDGKIVVGGYANEVTPSGVVTKFVVVRLTSTGELDTGFNGTGIVSTVIAPGTQSICNGVTVQPDGKIVASGVSFVGGIGEFAVLRLNSDGSFDTSFGGTGKVSTKIDVSEDNSRGEGVVLQADGKIVVGGSVTLGGVSRFAVARFNSNGTVDMTNSTQIDPGEDSSEGLSIVLQADGKIVVGGSVSLGGASRFAVARFNINGTVDTTFSTQIDPGETSSQGFALALQSDGKIVEVGTTQLAGTNYGAVARFNTDGSVDTTVTTTIDLAQTSGTGAGVCIQSDGKIIEVGSVNFGVSQKCAVARYNPNMTLDTTLNGTGTEALDLFFDAIISLQGTGVVQNQNGKLVVGGNGYFFASQPIFAVAQFNSGGLLDPSFNATGLMPGTALTQINSDGTSSSCYGIVVQSNEKIVLAGKTTIAGKEQFACARFNVNGTLDTNFNSGGSKPGTVAVQVNVLEDFSSGQCVALQQDGKIVIAGVVSLSGEQQIAVVRLHSNGTIDAIGFTKIDAGENFSIGNAIAIQPNGKIVVAGSVGVGSEEIAVARFNQDLTVDTTWHAKINPAESSSKANTVALQSDGKIVIAGEVQLSGNSRCAVARFLSDGTLDVTFNGTGTKDFQIDLGEISSVLKAIMITQTGKIVGSGYTASAIDSRFALVQLFETGSFDTTFGNGGITSTYINAGEIAAGAFALTIQSDNKIVAAGLTLSGSEQKMAVARFLGNQPAVMDLTAWLKTIYAEDLGYAPNCGDNQ